MPPSGEEEKVIINGGNSGTILIANAGLLAEVCSRIYDRTESGHLPDAKKLVLLANEIENDSFKIQKKIFKFQREFLRQVEFDGPWPDSMS